MFRMSQIPKDRYDEVMGHLDSSQGNDLKSLLMEALSGKDKEGSPMEEAKESPAMEAMEGKPKGISLEKVSVMQKPNPLSGVKKDEMGDKMDDVADQLTKPDDMKMGDDEEMSDDELKELLSKYLG